eukprot:s5373_g4.t1
MKSCYCDLSWRRLKRKLTLPGPAATSFLALSLAFVAFCNLPSAVSFQATPVAAVAPKHFPARLDRGMQLGKIIGRPCSWPLSTWLSTDVCAHLGMFGSWVATFCLVATHRDRFQRWKCFLVVVQLISANKLYVTMKADRGLGGPGTKELQLLPS